MTSSSAQSPLVSICLATYDGSATIERALKSLLAQTYPSYEIVISDDHSTDDTLAICERMAADHPKVRFVRPARNLGSEDNMRFVLAQVKGKYFVWACQDDYWDPEFLSCLVGALEKNPNAVCAQGWVRWFSEDGTREKDLRLYGRDLPETHTRLSLASSFLSRRGREDRLKVKNSIFMHGVWNREIFAAAVKAHGKPFSSERQILCQAALAGDFVYVDRMLFHKQFYDISLHERRPATDATVVIQDQSTRWTEAQDTFAAIRRSPIIAPWKKLVAIPILALSYFRHRSSVKNLATKRLARSLRFVWPQRQQKPST